MLVLRLCSPATLAVALLLCATLSAPAALTISEFQAVNNSTIRDEDGDYSDWIEIHNPTQAEQNFDGWYLTDSALTLTKWCFPNVVLPSGGYLVVFASDKNRTNTTAGRLHTNFKLNADGEHLALVDPTGNVASEFAPTYPKWPPAEVSFGRDRNEPSLVGFFSVPTPGNPNQAGGPGEFAPDIVFSRESGTYIDSFQLTLALWPPNSAAEIRYVIVNSAATAAQTNVPTSASALYTGPITVTGTMQVRARAFEAGRLPGTPASASFIQISANAVTFTSDLPLVVVHNFGSATIPNSSDQTAIVAWFDVDERTGRSSLTNRPTLITRAGVNRRGSSTEGYPKASLAVELWDEFNEDADHEVLGLPPESDWVLDAGNIFDPSHIHDAFAYELSNDLGRYAPRTRMVETFIDLTGGAINLPDFTSASDYHGIHVLEEKVKRNQNRVNIDRIQQENTTTPGVTGGWLFKIDRNDPDERTFNGAGATIIYMEPDGRNVQLPQWDAQEQYIRSYFTNFGAALNGPNWTNSIPGYAAYIDVDSWIDHHLMNVLTLSVDSLRLSAHFYKPRNGKIEMGPVWDFGRALGANAKGADWRPFNPRAWRAANTLGGTDYGTDFFNASTPPPWWARLFTDPDFFQRYIDIYQRHRATVFDTNRILAKIDRLAELVRDAQTREALRWSGPGSSDSSPRSGTVTSPVNIYGNTCSYTFPTPGTYQGEIDFLKHWLTARIHFMDTNFLDRPFFGREGGLITGPIELGIAEPSTEEGTRVLYTLDGADPRLPGGGVSPSARVYSGPFLVATNAHVVARSHNVNHRNLTGPGHPPISSPWSGAAEIVLYRSLPALRITEVMYHPPSLPGDTNAADEFEYIEVTNTGTTILNLGGFRIRGGIEFDFGGRYLGPGQSAVVVANSAAFISRYGNQRMILGVHSDRLSNAGERLILEGPLREPIHDFTYSDTWHPITDGHGFSLVIRNPSLHVAAWDSAVNWRSSGASGIPPILVNEVLTHPAAPSTDTIELHNPTPFQVDISGWFLTDDFSVPTKYRIPENTVVAANGFVLFNEAQFNTGPRAFALSSLGDEVWLFSGDGTNLTGYAHGFEFGAAFNGVTFGRNVRSSGGDDLPAQAIATLGTLNGVPRVGPIVISEIMYHPRSVMRHTVARDNHLDEFIELENITDQLVPLHDVQRPTNTWRLRGAVEFDFPAGEAVPAHARILIVGFDPADTLKLDSFRARNGVSPAIPIYGPFRGTLDNASAAIELSRPDRPEPSGPPYFGLVPYPLVERIEYSALPPWPAAADGVGASLQRLFASFYGNDPINWRAALPTPGGSPASKNPPIVTQQPASQTVIAFNTAVFSVEANGAGNRYQWRFNGAPIFRETNDTLTLPNVQKNQQGVYDAVIYNAEGSMTSAEARLTVLVPMALTRQPQSVIMRGSTDSATYGHTFSNAAFSVAAISTSPLSYQWRHNRNDIPGATARIFAITNANLTHEGLYDCVLSDSVSTQRTAAAQLRIDVPLHILRQPQPVIALEGDDVALSVEHVGSGPFGYRWRRNGINIHPGSGYTSLRVLNIPDVTTNSSGAYTVVVTNIVPPGVLSGGAALTVLADSDHDQAPDTWETEFGFLPNDPADGSMDFDQDGVTNADEFRSGTDPRDNASYLRVEEFTLDGVAPASRLTFLAVSNRSYSVQYKDAPDPASVWTTLENVFSETASRTTVIIDPAHAPHRFYRLVTPLVQE
jgi:hypothetical protein